MLFRTANLTQLAEFDEIIDVRTPAEFAEDHIPGATNYPVLSNEERITVGTLYKQSSPFEAKKIGAVMVAKNIAQHIETNFHSRPKSWSALIYCWRGGQRSGAMSIVLGQIGWAVKQLEGGYKTYRSDVLQKLESLPATFNYKVICGATGSGKSHLLTALAAAGKQVLDLEKLAQHRGSVLGGWPLQTQPTQKSFDSTLLQTLKSFDPSRPVFIEAESNKIGRITLPNSLFKAMHAGDCLLLETALEARIQLLLTDYQHFLTNPALLSSKLQSLLPFHGRTQLDYWQQLIAEEKFTELIADLLAVHYDPSYHKATSKHYSKLAQPKKIQLLNLSDTTLQSVIETLI